MRVTNLNSPRSGSPVANQYEITGDDGTVTFQSYQTPIAQKNGYNYRISADWNYSRTTAKYFYEWLRGYGWNGAEIEELKKFLKRAKAGEQFVLPNMAVNIEYVEELK